MNLALFDFDGTITTKGTFPDFMRFAVVPAKCAVGNILFAPRVLGYKLGFISGSDIRTRVTRFGFRGVAADEVRRAGHEFARDVLPDLLRPSAMEKIQWHKNQGDVVVIVSGAFDVYLSPWCVQHQLHLICSQLEVVDGTLTGRYRGEQCVNAEKSRRVREKYDLEKFLKVYAYGDTKEDMDMLNLATERYFRWEKMR